ncbi:MAG: S49 family peptidase [Pseudomonadota bacterium]
MNGFMAVVHNVRRKSGLDLLLHTPGGGTEATRALVEYLYKMFGHDIRVIVPHMAMSAGTMIACASKEIVMGKHSSLGPTDPQVKGHPAMGVLSEVERALKEIKAEPAKQLVYQHIFAKYPPAFVQDCERQVQGSSEMIERWLRENMLSGQEDPASSAKKTRQGLMNYEGTTEHAHHFMVDTCTELGLCVLPLEKDQELQEDVLSVHHSFVASFARTDAIKIIENGEGQNWIVST